jgi:competence protein ComEA
MQALKNIAIGILIGLLSAAFIVLISSPPSGVDIELIPTTTQPPITIYITGAVVRPGLYVLEPHSRISDALKAAGGLLANADPSALNLAQVLIDGQKIYAPKINEKIYASETTISNFKVDINSATLEELEQLPGIGSTKAEAIITYRQTIGGFDTIDQIQNVPGIGPVLFDNIKEFIFVSPRN